MTVSPLIPVAHALTSLDSHEAAMRIMLRHTSIAPTKIMHRFFDPDRVSEEAHAWAQVWASLNGLDPDNYQEAVNDARRFLAAHLEEHVEWEQTLEGLAQFREDAADGPSMGP